MASGAAAGLKVAVAIAVLAVLVMSSQGHPKKPLCSDCLSLCNTNCSAVVAAACNSTCSPPVAPCESCKSQVLQGCCQSFCSNSSSSNDTSSTISSCCPSDCISGGGDCATCSCDKCKTDVQNLCAFPCSMHASDMMRCQACQNGAAQQCMTPCMSTCNDHCVKKDY